MWAWGYWYFSVKHQKAAETLVVQFAMTCFVAAGLVAALTFIVLQAWRKTPLMREPAFATISDDGVLIKQGGVETVWPAQQIGDVV